MAFTEEQEKGILDSLKKLEEGISKKWAESNNPKPTDPKPVEVPVPAVTETPKETPKPQESFLKKIAKALW